MLYEAALLIVVQVEAEDEAEAASKLTSTTEWHDWDFPDMQNINLRKVQA